MKQLLRLLAFLLFPFVGLAAVGDSCEEIDYFYIDHAGSNEEFIRLCVPDAFPYWFAMPSSSILHITDVGQGEVDGEAVQKVRVVFAHAQLNSILEAFNALAKEEPSEKWRPRWPPTLPSTQCGQCKFRVSTFITVSVLGAVAAAGTEGPGAYAVWQSLVIAAYGQAAWEAVKAVVFSATVDVLAKKICEAKGKCN